MITPLEIENKKFSKKTLNGYDPEEVDDFLDELTKDYESLYKIVEKLQKLGYNDKVIKGIFYDNFLKFINREY